MDLIIGNVCSLFATITDSISSSRKTSRGILLVQCLSQFFYGAGAIILKGYSGAAQNAVSVLRNLAALRKVRSRALEWFLVVLAVGLGLLCNNRGLIGVLPVVANLQYTLAIILRRDNERLLKFTFLINTLLYAVFNYVILNFVGVVCNVIVSISLVIFLVKGKGSKQQSHGGGRL